MRFREWLHPHRQLLLALVAVAIVSAGALGWLGWLLITQDAVLARQQETDRLQQRAETAAAAVRASLADLPRLAASTSAALSPSDGVLRVDLTARGVFVRSDARVLWVPPGTNRVEEPSAGVDDAEAREFNGDVTGALLAYERVVRNRPHDASAVARVARVLRKLHRPAAAVTTYDRLDPLSTAVVDGLPATLVARVGRASVYADVGPADALRREAGALRDDLLVGRWPLSRGQFDFYRGQAAAWLGTPVNAPDAAVARAEALEWAWTEVRAASGPGTQALRFSSGPAVVAWSPDAGLVRTLVVDARYLSAACAAQAEGFDCALLDGAGTPLAGSDILRGPSARLLTDASGSAWLLRLAETGATPVETSPRRPLLLYTVAVAALVLAAGWYFILRAMARERAAGRAQADFVAAVSHEFRSPLTSMSHIAELLATGRIAGEAQARAFDVLVRDSDRLRSLVEQLLEFGRFEAGGPVLRLERLDAAGAVRGIVDQFRARAVRDGYTVSFDGPDIATWIQADREALTLALWNLMDNAVKYSPDAKTIWVRLQHSGASIEIVVRDNGLGIPAGEQRSIFRQFVRGEEPKARIRGTGIGLGSFDTSPAPTAARSR
jgi:hypothetical protein